MVDKLSIIPVEGETSIVLAGPATLPIKVNGVIYDFKWYTWTSIKGELDIQKVIRKITSTYSSILIYGDFNHAKDVLVRMHSICHTGDVFHSQKCDCGYQFDESLKKIVEHGDGALFYLANHEGRGIGLFNKNLAYALQEVGLDTVEANEALGLKDDNRDYYEAARIIQYLRVEGISLITNNPSKMSFLSNLGIHIKERVPIWGEMDQFNQNYLTTKINKNGHLREENKIHVNH
ncbi:GTP cyclohydrolase II (plasmid) [Alkalihalophilus sp. As8PL]|uniref:GTP cyclohydrolase II n=1 Tax=Alkalihalophilus sp. As8PL TaxID=3237103 RepID=A0AB39BMJ8_9BACI